MSPDPKRWLDDAGDAPEGARELLAHARRTTPPDKGALVLSAAALVKLGTQPASAAAAVMTKLAAAPNAIVALPLAGKLALAATTLAVVAVVSTQVVQRNSATHSGRAAEAALVSPASKVRAAKTVEPAAMPAPAPAISAPAAPAVVVTAVPAGGEAAASGSPPGAERARGAKTRRARAPGPAARTMALTPVTTATATAPEPSEDPLALEVRWLDRARALLASDPAAALAHADAYAQRFPGGALSAERELIAIDALQRMGRAREARARADVFAQRHPGSLYRERLQRLLRVTAR